jgi:ADP-ribose pyrophosphatase YjhB (NUDIX family)
VLRLERLEAKDKSMKKRGTCPKLGGRTQDRQRWNLPMANNKDSFCSYCGTAFAPPLRYPRKCKNPACGMEVWSNPIPVSVVLVPVRDDRGIGLLVVRRAIEPRIGKLVLTGGFIEEHEPWQIAAAREVYEEAGVTIEASRLEPLWFTSTEPRPNRVLLFSVAAELSRSALPPFVPNAEASERGLVYGPRNLSEIFAFPLHARAAELFFSSIGVDGPHGYTQA